MAPALPSLSRAQLCGRIWAVSRALEELACQAHVDGHGPIPGAGALEATLAGYQQRLAALDGTVPANPFAAAVTSRRATGRLQRAGAELASVRSDLAADRDRSNARARHHAQELPRTGRIREMAELNRIPMDELLEMAPTFARELQAERWAE